MTDSPQWRRFESGGGFGFKTLRFLVCVSSIALLCFAATLPLTWPQQTVLGLLSVLFVIWLDRSSNSSLITLTLMLVSVFSTFRYGLWRLATTVGFFRDPGSNWNGLDAFFVCLLLAAETYAASVLVLGYFQTLWPLRRTPAPLPDDPAQWPAVDLLITTYNEPLSVVRQTALAAMNIDWPIGKLNIYLLDDGRRDEFRKFAEETGIGYMTRDDNLHAKAGNINRALARIDSPFVAIFDCDHIPTRSFLQLSMGWFLRDEKLGMLQTPQHYYSPDPFERNLGQFRTVPNEGELFYGVVQNGNDFWNAAFFCGSCAVIRRTALDQVGGMAVETVTEDAHTSLRMQMRGWNSAYINIPQAAGLAPERLSGHVRQRIRWARGMVQVLRTDNPFFSPGLTTAQRLCYFNAMSHFLYALPRLVFLTAPLIYLIFGHINIPGYWAAILAYALPHLVLSNLTNSRIQGQHRHSFWNEVYETVLAPYLLLPTLFTLISPKLGRFNVTVKGGTIPRRFFDARIAAPFLLLLAFNAVGILCAVPRFWQFPASSGHWTLTLLAGMYDGHHPGTIVMNLLWACFNIILLGVATAVAWESRQQRKSVRIAVNLPAEVRLPNGSSVHGVTSDLSMGGVMVRMEHKFKASSGNEIRITLPVLSGSAEFPATIVGVDGDLLRAKFAPLGLREEEALTLALYSRADTWLGWGESRESDRPLKSLSCIVRLSLRGLTQTVGALFSRTPKPGLAANIVPLLLIGALATGALRAQATPASEQMPTASSMNPSPGTFDRTVSFADLGVAGAMVLRGTDAHRIVHFSLPPTQMVKTATLKLHYHFSPGLVPTVSHLNISLNGTLVTTLTVAPAPVVTEQRVDVPLESPTGDSAADALRTEASPLLEAAVTLPAELLSRDNDLTFEFVGHYKANCEDPANSTLWSHIDAASSIEFAGALQPLQNDLRLLPLPFYDAQVDLHPTVPIVFLSQPSPQALQAAGIVASWFGIFAATHPVRFPVTIGTIPAGNVIVFSENASALPPALQLSGSTGSVIAMMTNPSDPYGKVLLLAGGSSVELLTAARALALQRDLLQGERVSIKSLTMPAARQPDDAPRWLRTDNVIPMGNLAQPAELQSDGIEPVTLYMRLPPDLYYGTMQDLGLHLRYRYNAVPLGEGSTLQVSMNGNFVSATPLPHAGKAEAQPEALVPVPVADMRPFSNTLRMKFAFHAAESARCEDSASPAFEGAILKDSWLDLRGIPHWAVLPNLEIFANAGYPFTRKADLADTAVVLPDTPSTEEIDLYLALMGHFGAQTGYPVLNVTVTNAGGMTPGAKDYLVLGTVDDQTAISRLNPSLPIMADGSGLHIQDTQGFFSQFQHAWWKVRSSDRVQSGQLETSGGLPDALIEATQWPNRSGHSAVLIVLRDTSEVPAFVTSFFNSAQSSDISQTVSVLHGTRFASYRIGNVVYGVGSLSVWVRINIFFARYPWAMAAVIALCCILLAILARAVLRRRARARLDAGSKG
ncbi:UDP-forming cellulose synthase catalytic subunit [Edaphobacter sp.]|uniref:UDP-forming cellulose synthase catalytic subunit n=1 Tax=Edaphobacter sp. TaxID=1934404 RepID=UPI002DBFE1E9|nr:UDP-forming cellulose synthase catalytic subunit [Edaphobacter sp.]HEU5342389.1 UDP-forming cellulose synthase catalytic subunit [Edaphobacter sp.]